MTSCTPPGTLSLYFSAPHPCNYLAGRTAVNLVADPQVPLTTELYSSLVEQGFRRSGDFAYRPHCPNCRSCVAVRLPVASFAPRRIQRRILRRNADLQMVRVAPAYRNEHFELYRRYLEARHPDGGMDNPDPNTYLRFLTAPRVRTEFYEFRCGGRLLALAITDRLRNGLSAVYTCFDPDPDQSRRSLGGYALLKQAEEALRLGLPYLYLGYWVDGCDKMSYKAEYRPLEGFIDGRWQVLQHSAA